MKNERFVGRSDIKPHGPSRGGMPSRTLYSRELVVKYLYHARQIRKVIQMHGQIIFYEALIMAISFGPLLLLCPIWKIHRPDPIHFPHNPVGF